MNEKVKSVLESILEKFKNNDVPKAISYSMFPMSDIPCSKWSLCNRLIIFFSDTQDARGFKQWLSINRHVKKGVKAIYILAPRMIKIEDEGEEKKIIKGFLSIPVFRYEDTEGEELNYKKIELPRLPLMEKAEKWGVNVKAIPGNYHFYGCYSNNKKEISLATKEESVFFHELAHAAHARIEGSLKNGQDWKQEIIAELSACTLCNIVGKDGSKYIGNNYRYIESYAKKAKMSPFSACMCVLNEVEKVLQLILN